MASFQSRDRSASSSTSRTRIGRTTVSSRINIRIDAQIVHPSRIRWRPALRPDEDVAVAVLNAHQGGLTDCAGLITDVGYDDHRQPCITQGGAFGTATTFVKLDLLAHPVSGAGNIICHGTLPPYRGEGNQPSQSIPEEPLRPNQARKFVFLYVTNRPVAFARRPP